MNMEFVKRSLASTLFLFAAATLTTVTALADPPPNPELTVYNRTPFTISGCWGVSYVEAGNANVGQTFNGIPGDTCYSDRVPETSIAAGQSQTRALAHRFSTDGVSTVYLSYMRIAGKTTTPINDYMSGKGGPFEKYSAALPGGKLKMSVGIGLSSGFLGLGGTGWTGRDYVRIYLDWVQ